MAAITICSDFGAPKKIKSDTLEVSCSHKFAEETLSDHRSVPRSDFFYWLSFSLEILKVFWLKLVQQPK